MTTSPAPQTRRTSVFRKVVKILFRIFLTIIIILVIVIVLIQTPYVQNIVRGKAEKYLSRKLNTRVNIGHLYIGFPHVVELKDIYIEDRQKDTLLSAGLIAVDLKMWELLHSNIDIRSIQLANLTIKVKRLLPDTAFNFQFIADAFAGAPDTVTVKEPSKPMKMSLGLLMLDKIRMIYKDTVTGNDMEVWIEHNRTEMDEFDPANLRFHVSSFALSGLSAKIYQEQPLPASISTAAPPPPPPPSVATAPFDLQLGTINIDKSSLDYRNTVSNLFANLSLGHLATQVQIFDMAKQIIRLKEFTMDSSSTAVRLGKSKPVVKKGTAATTDTSGGWHFILETLGLNGDHVVFDDDNQRRQTKGMDFGHLNINDLTLHGSSLSYDADSTAGVVTAGKFTEQSGFRLTALHTRFLYSLHETWLKDLFLSTPGTTLQRSVALKYTSLAAMMKDPKHSLVDLDLNNSKIAVRDILTFVPGLQTQPVFAHPEDTWLIDTRVTGNLDRLNIQTLQFSGIRDIRVDLSGTVLHPLDNRRISADLAIRHLSGSRDALIAILPKGTLPGEISIPSHFDLAGKVNGGMEGFQSDLVLNTSSGTILLKGTVRQFRQPQQATYDLALQTKGLDLGYILRDPVQYGRITSIFTVKGQGLDLNSANAAFTGRVASATVRHYAYQNLSLDGSIANRQAQFQSSISNTAVQFKLQASADLARKFPALKLDWQIDTLDAHVLGFVKDILQFKGHISADFADTNPDSLQGSLNLAKLVLVQGKQKFSTDSITLIASRQNNLEDIQFHSEMADLDWKGQYKLTETGRAIQHTINQFYRTSTIGDTVFTAQDWQMKGQFRPSPLVLAYLPALKGSDSLGFLVAYNSDRNDLNVRLLDPHIHFGNQDLQQFMATATTSNGQLKYSIGIGGGFGSGFQLHQTSISGSLHDDKLFTDLVLKDSKGKNRYRLAGELDKLNDGIKFALNPDSLLLNYDAWKVGADNYFQYDSAGIIIHDFAISHDSQSLAINSNPPAPKSPIDVRFTDFRLNTLSRFADQDSLLIDGLLNGTAQVKNIMSSPVFTSDLVIKDLSYKNDTVGDLALKVNNEKANAYAADLSLEGKNNDVKIKGEYYTGDSSRLNMNLDLAQLNLAAFRHAIEGQVQDMRGYLKGKLAITGSLDKPQLKGNLHFDSTRITPVVSGEPLIVSKDNIEFDADGFNFSQFTLQDSSGNKLAVDGNVYTPDYRNYSFDISVNASNFRLVNAPESNSRQFYGALNLDAAANLTGAMDNLKVDGDVRVNKKTNFYFVLPGSDPEVVDRLGVVRFMDRAHPGDTLVDKSVAAAKARATTVKGLDIAVNIQTDSSAIFTMVIDERTGDALNVRGRSNLVFGMDKSGKTDLTGNYEVESGSYSLSFDVLKRKFDIQRGSTITWTGDPTTATLDVTANYTANTASIDLIANEVAGRPQNDINKFNQKLPFLVTLKMEGELLKPKITFDITLPPNVLTLWPDIDAKLQQIRIEQSELNKQVFALLLLNRFVGEDPLRSQAGGGSTLGNMAFQSASQILTNQLDNLAGSLIKGVDIHFDLNNQQDFSTGTEQDYTELNVSVSKRLFNDRISVNVGSDFDVQGNNAPGQSASNLAGDVAVDYRLTKDGRYMVRAYRKNQYEAVVEGQVVETGVSFILTFDYNRFKEIFGKTKEDKLQERTRQKSPAVAPSASTTQGASTPAATGASTPNAANGPVTTKNPNR